VEKDFFKKLFNHLPYGVLLINADGAVVFQNKTTGVLLAEIYNGQVGCNFFNELKHFPLRYAVNDSISKRVAFRQEFELATDSIVQIDGDSYHDQLCPNGILLSIYSISQFKKLEKHNRQFVANVSHELKTPLTAIIGYIETLIDSDDLTKEMRGKFLKIVKKNSQRLSQIVNDLLTLSSLEKDEASTEGITLIPGKVRSVVKEAISVCEYKANAKNVCIDFVGELDFSCELNAGLMEQAIVNLIDNAIKYTPDSGRVNVVLDQSNKNVVIRVSDIGQGIPSRYHARIFERFFSVDKARSRTMGGSGLGLSIVKHIVLNHHGQVFVEDNIPSGSVFTILVPKL
jgi:two-component system, OmpR family, phosphate regulon sensor histidine kinase PhoR